MIKSIHYIFFLSFLFQLGIVSTSMANAGDPNVRDLRILAKWFEGEFDNDSQIWFEGRGDWTGKADEKHGRIHVIHKRIHSDKIGKYAFYIEEYMDDDTTNIVRQRVVSFVSDQEAGGIRMELYFLKDSKKYIGAFKDIDLLNAITKENLITIDGCDVIFKREGEQYHGSMGDKACQFGEGELRRYSVHDMIVSKDQYWRVDRTFLVKDDSFHKGHPNAEHYKMRRVTNYSCNVSFHEIAYYVPSDKDKRYKNVIIHNQGGMNWFHNPVTDKKYGVQLREKEYPFYEEGSDFFMLRFIEEGQKASTVIVTASPGTKSVSFQIGWASAHCKAIE